MIDFDVGYQGIVKLEEMVGKRSIFRIAIRQGKRRALPTTQDGRLQVLAEIAKGYIRVKVEHPFCVIKQRFGFHRRPDCTEWP